MSRNRTRVVVLGDGGWGTTLALVLNSNGAEVTIWGAFADYVSQLRRTRENKKFLPGINIPETIDITHDLNEALLDKDVVVLAVPSQHMRSVLKQVARCNLPRRAAYVSVTKGIEVGSLKRMSELVTDELGRLPFAVLSGPTIATEVANRIPTAAVVASKDIVLRRLLQKLFMTERLRIYTNDDVVGIELGGSLKNVIAIACGISDGLGFGTNAKAAILTRGLAEMARLGVAMGAKVPTFFGISGLGDLVTTCTNPHSRNRCVGEEIGKGKTLKQVISGMQMVAEGVATAKSAYELSRKMKIEMPITTEVYRVLYRNKSPLRAVNDLMRRRGKEE